MRRVERKGGLVAHSERLQTLSTERIGGPGGNHIHLRDSFFVVLNLEVFVTQQDLLRLYVPGPSTYFYVFLETESSLGLIADPSCISTTISACNAVVGGSCQVGVQEQQYRITYCLATKVSQPLYSLNYV